TTGKFLRNITAGAEVAITGVRDSTAGRMAECRVGTLASADDLVLIRSADLNVYPGALDTVSPIQISRYRLYAKLQGELQTVTKEKTSTERRDNPHWNAYQSTKANYDTYWQRVKELTENRDKASDDERMKWGDELRRLKGEDIRIGKAYEAARDQYKAWNAAHPTPVASSSPRAVALQKSLQSLRASLQEPATLP
ncbi:MAG: hypothetical protein O3B24_04970, partial [Verrucomicrobia bacterium]|nr:hypothetical protein [Verrucomicrobiota bacterium]